MKCGAPATEVDHIVNNDDHSETNLQSLCVDCHKAKTAREAARSRELHRGRGWGGTN
ncbi:MAG: HNH endonuclease [Acidimicrobiia bacterium]|nr:HNH endonuclease [Acidimicrobiia bacterium]